MSKIYKLQHIGGSIYICIPSSFFSSKMLEDKCVKVKLLEKRGGFAVIRLEELDEKYDISAKTDREDASKFGFADFIRKAG